jgi:glycine/D-amino acid oxidase-like deaminating enzyme
VFGAWSAKFLTDARHRVTLIDAYGPANSRASSADHSRVIRAGYGADAIYSHWATDSWPHWAWLQEQSGRPLITRTGAVFLGEPDNAYVRATHTTLTHLGIAAETIEAAALQARYPQIAVDDLGVTVFEPGAGVIRARDAVQTLVRHLVSAGVTYRQELVLPIDEQSPTLEVRTQAGADVDADAYVFACGPWLPKLFPQTIGGRIRATRQEVLYFGVPPGIRGFSARELPVWIDFAAGAYGIGDVDGQGFKVGIDRHGVVVDPDTLDRAIDASLVAATRTSVGRRFPALADAPLVDARVCQYENTSSGDFLIDRHPLWPHCWIVGGGSGHGFKHGPAVGQHVASLVSGGVAVHQRFALATKTVLAARAVF